ncbi:MAG: aminoacyl-tRNA hydrolase [Patescibacteria group bacterium]
MKCIIGLGNPGKKYSATRHNIGFMVLDALAKKADRAFKANKNLRAEIAKGALAGQAVILAKPLTYMNLSGQAVAAVLQYYKLEPNDLILVYDDVDIDFGRIRLKPYGTSAGHNGVASVIEQLGTTEFSRCRVGIKLGIAEKDLARYHKRSMARFVLDTFSAEQKKLLREIIAESAEAIELALSKGLAEAMNKFN